MLHALSPFARNSAPVRRLFSSPAWQGGFSSAPFRFFALAQLFTFTALVGQMIVRGWMVQELTDSPFLVSLVPSLQLLPALFIGPAGGYLADRFERRYVVFWGEVAMLASFGSLTVLSLTDSVETWHVLATTALIGISYSLSSPARQALIVDTVPAHLERRGIGSYMLVMHLTLLVAPVIAGTLLSGPGISAALVVTTLLAAVVLPLYLRVRTVGPRLENQARESVVKSLKGGVREIFANPQLRWMFAGLTVIVLFINTWGAMFPTIAQDVLGRGAGGLGGITVAVGIGAIGGAVFSMAIEGKVGDGRQQFGAALLFGGLIIGVALSTSYPLTLVLTVLASAAGAPYFINNMAASQAVTPGSMKAKVVSVRYIVLAVQPIGMILLGAAAEIVGPQAALAGSCMIGMALMALVAVSAFGDRIGREVRGAVTVRRGALGRVRGKRTPAKRAPVSR